MGDTGSSGAEKAMNMPASKRALVEINTKVMDDLKRLFSPGNDLQKFIDMEVPRLADPYAPSDTAALRKSVFLETSFGSGEIRYQVYGNENGRNSWNDTTSQFQDRPVRGPFWVKRMLDSGGREKLKLAIAKWFEKRG